MIQLDQRQLQAGLMAPPRIKGAEEVEFWIAQREYRNRDGTTELIWVCQCMHLPPTGPRAVVVWSKDASDQSKEDAIDLARLLVKKYMIECKAGKRKPDWIEHNRRAPRDVQVRRLQIW